jgi:hypothetical protein
LSCRREVCAVSRDTRREQRLSPRRAPRSFRKLQTNIPSISL